MYMYITDKPSHLPQGKPSEVSHVSTGSSETECIVRAIVKTLVEKGDSWDTPITWSEIAKNLEHKTYDRLYYLRVMAFGRNARTMSEYGATDAYPGSQAEDDTGGYLELLDGMTSDHVGAGNYLKVQLKVSKKVKASTNLKL